MIFNIESKGIYKIVTFLGLKLKFCSAKLVYKELENIISEKYDKLSRKLCKYLPKERYPEYLKDWYLEKTGELLDLEHPKTFNEKIQWLKLYDSTPIKTKLANKYLVRDWVKAKIGDDCLIKLLGVWDNFDDINFDELPNKFVLKCNHGCRYNIIVKDKSKLDLNSARKSINNWLNEDISFRGLELHYSEIPKKILAEEYIENTTGELNDYKFYCFNGKVHYIQYIGERSTGYKMVFFDREWNAQDFISNNERLKQLPKKPKRLEELIKNAEILAAGFKFVRVDFYILDNDDVKFGEMTFTAGNGILNWQPKSANLMMGQLLDLSDK